MADKKTLENNKEDEKIQQEITDDKKKNDIFDKVKVEADKIGDKDVSVMKSPFGELMVFSTKGRSAKDILQECLDGSFEFCEGPDFLDEELSDSDTSEDWSSEEEGPSKKAKYEEPDVEKIRSVSGAAENLEESRNQNGSCSSTNNEQKEK